MAREEVPKGLQTKEMAQFTKLYARMALLRKMIEEKTMATMAKGRSLIQMLEEIRGKQKEMIEGAPQPSNELPGQEEMVRGGEERGIG